jgi:hypothetical protein
MKNLKLNLLGKVKKLKNYDKSGKILKHIDLNKFENNEVRKEIAIKKIKRWISNKLA